MASKLPEKSAQVREQVRILQSRQDDLVLKQRALEDLLAEFRQRALKERK